MTPDIITPWRAKLELAKSHEHLRPGIERAEDEVLVWTENAHRELKLVRLVDNCEINERDGVLAALRMYRECLEEARR